jgi:thiamine biosynthesis protein ThiS
MNIIVNGFKEDVAQNATIKELIQHFQEGDVDLIVEHNGRFVYPAKYAETVVMDGDRIEFINPNFGG